jgi:hypothetical protein
MIYTTSVPQKCLFLISKGSSLSNNFSSFVYSECEQFISIFKKIKNLQIHPIYSELLPESMYSTL